jgi:hypothetical protein
MRAADVLLLWLLATCGLAAVMLPGVALVADRRRPRYHGKHRRYAHHYQRDRPPLGGQ